MPDGSKESVKESAVKLTPSPSENLHDQAFKAVTGLQGRIPNFLELELLKRVENDGSDLEAILLGATEIANGNMERGMAILDALDGTIDGKCFGVPLDDSAPVMRPGRGQTPTCEDK